jgi:hypothetical protein
MTPQEQAALVALRALHGALEVARDRYLNGDPEDGMRRWEPTSRHLRYHAAANAYGRALGEFVRDYGHEPQLD